MWHYSINGERLGPVSTGQLKVLAASGRLHPTDLVWKEGMAKWVPAVRVKGLFAVSPPPVPAVTPSPPGISPSPLAATSAAPSPFEFESTAVPHRSPPRQTGISILPFFLLFVAVAGSFVGLVALSASAAPKDKPPPWDAVPMLCAFLAVGVAATPVLVGTLKKGESHVLAELGGYRIYFYEPKSLAGWTGYYFLAPCMAVCFVMAIIVPLMAAHVYGESLAREEARRRFPKSGDWWS